MFEVPEKRIRSVLECPDEPAPWREVLHRISLDKPADLETVAALMHACKVDPEACDRVISHADRLKKDVFGSSVKLFIPIYISNECVNECLYCAYRSPNPDMPRRTLSKDEFRRELEEVARMGYRVIELVTSECPALMEPGVLPKYVSIAREVLDSAASSGVPPEIILMSWALSEDEFASVRDAGLDAFYLWQETYDVNAYTKMHAEGTPKADFAWRAGVFDRAVKSGIKNIGLGVLFGLADWKFDVLALIAHGNHLEREYGVRPEVIGLPRFKHAQGVPIEVAPRPVTDDELRLAVALYRLAFPTSHIFLNTREKLPLLLKLLEGGGSEMNIACAVFPGGYTEPTRDRQFDFYSYPTGKTLALLSEKGYEPTHFVSPNQHVEREGSHHVGQTFRSAEPPEGL